MQIGCRDVRSIIDANKACFPVLGVYMRFAKKSEAYLSSSYGEDSMMFEIHIPKDSTGYLYERGIATYDEIQQMTLLKYNYRPHWAKNSKAAFKDTLALYPEADRFIQAKKQN